MHSVDRSQDSSSESESKEMCVSRSWLCVLAVIMFGLAGFGGPGSAATVIDGGELPMSSYATVCKVDHRSDECARQDVSAVFQSRAVDTTEYPSRVNASMSAALAHVTVDFDAGVVLHDRHDHDGVVQMPTFAIAVPDGARTDGARDVTRSSYEQHAPPLWEAYWLSAMFGDGSDSEDDRSDCDEYRPIGYVAVGHHVGRALDLGTQPERIPESPAAALLEEPPAV